MPSDHTQVIPQNPVLEIRLNGDPLDRSWTGAQEDQDARRKTDPGSPFLGFWRTFKNAVLAA
jgi:hypothetical protein